MPVPYLVDLVGATVALRRRGNRFVGLCPFHAEKTPSFHIFDKHRKWMFHCHGCGAHGDAIDWLRRTRSLTYAQARAALQLPPLTTQQRSALHQAQTDRRRRQAALAKYRDNHPHCGLPDFAIDVQSNSAVTAEDLGLEPTRYEED